MPSDSTPDRARRWKVGIASDDIPSTRRNGLTLYRTELWGTSPPDFESTLIDAASPPSDRDALLEQLRTAQTLLSALVEDFAPDGQGDVSGPHLAEPEVWAELQRAQAEADHFRSLASQDTNSGDHNVT